ncbi:MAG: hypothetical protein Q4C01_04880 [Clostridia bacterium]|nr:hypothetical protein [Clostridia bacterium]
MRCSCQKCGTYMVQNEKGLDSGCICPECFTKCSACMGGEEGPLDKDSLRMIALLREVDRLREDDM